ncbi:MAG: alkaline phosphatase family protein, partial [Spirochaetota bacterium]
MVSTTKNRAQRLILIGIDSAILGLLKYFMDEGSMPYLSKLVQRGVVCESLPSLPVDTPTNWTTIATGANSRTHGVTSFTAHVAGESLEIGELMIGRTKESTWSQAD